MTALIPVSLSFHLIVVLFSVKAVDYKPTHQIHPLIK